MSRLGWFLMAHRSVAPVHRLIHRPGRDAWLGECWMCRAVWAALHSIEMRS